ncbi:hypothetical protein CHISP_1273 [Chitinispirillum alkaliphilum]|nr:hypothetical protein CHISP_1273 [Chitinispirillum alkaliphilum]
MASIDLNKEERDVLAEILENTLSDLRMEIPHTDSPFYKDSLRSKKAVVLSIIQKLKEAMTDS